METLTIEQKIEYFAELILDFEKGWIEGGNDLIKEYIKSKTNKSKTNKSK